MAVTDGSTATPTKFVSVAHRVWSDQGVTVTDVWPRPSGPVACVTVTVMIFVPAVA
jgi:hypothetical protein